MRRKRSKGCSLALVAVFILIIAFPKSISAGWLPSVATVKGSQLMKSMFLSGSLLTNIVQPGFDGIAVEPTDKDNQVVQMAFRDFDLKRLDASEKEFNIAVTRWKDLHRPRDEIVSLLKAR